MKKIRVLSILPDIIPSTILCVIKPMLFLQKENKVDFRLTFSELPRKGSIDWADVIVFCRNIETRDLLSLEYAKRKKKKVLYELDDNFFEISQETPLGKYYHNADRIKRLEDFLSYSDLIRVHSKPLFEKAKRYNNNVVFSKGYFDFSLISNKVNKRHDSKIRITYATSRGNTDHLQYLITEAISDISHAYPDTVEFLIFGSRLPIKAPNIHSIPFKRNYDKFIRTFYKMGCDIGLAPMENDLFHRSKTNNKYREYGACGIAGIYSDVSLYRSCIKNGINGLLVDNSPHGWYSAMERLITDPELLRKIKTNAYKDVLENYSMPDFCHRLFNNMEFLFSLDCEDRQEKNNPNSAICRVNSISNESTTCKGHRIDFLFDKVKRLKEYGFIGSLRMLPVYLVSIARKVFTTIYINHLRRC
jgi:glycosyltransferase involved in cell wall biosynthesis